jgi:2-polyprenyl-3-methyl-5-hydroxy-6-metoxy-1,4-benzoquinol methylase
MNSPKPRDINRTCPVCGRDEGVPYLAKGDLRLVRCGGCSMVYANPAPAAFASGEYYDQAGAGYYLSADKLGSDYADVRFERELRLFRRHCVGGSVLDVGCSSGGFLYQARKRFPGIYDILGTDASGPALDYAESRGVPVVRGDFLSHDFGGRTFDAVTFWAVLEHLLAPRAFLEKAAALLKPEGLCFVLVPNLGSVAMRFLGARYRYVYPQHLNYFGRKTLSSLVEKQFTVVETRTTHFNPVVIWQDWQRGGREVPNEERGELLKRTTAMKQSGVMKPVKWVYGMVERGLGAMSLADNLAMVLKKRV